MHLPGDLASFAAFTFFFFTPKAQSAPRPQKKPKTDVKFLSTWRVAFF
jgi:hypothetical protein